MVPNAPAPIAASTRSLRSRSEAARPSIATLAWLTREPAAVVGAGAAAAVLIVFRHRSNLRRLFAGTERRFGREEAVTARSVR